MADTQPLPTQQKALVDELVRIGEQVERGEISEADGITRGDALMERIQMQVSMDAERTVRRLQSQRQRNAQIKLAVLAVIVLSLWLLHRYASG